MTGRAHDERHGSDRGAPLTTGALLAVLVACAAGLVHAAFSVYWALGGRWLLPTVGEWAVTAVEDSPIGAGVLLGAVGLGKALAALVPVGVAFHRLPWVGFWRVVCGIGGTLLVAYGGVNVVVSVAVLAGFIRPEGGYDESAMIGHAFLWDPLFLIWGTALLAWLVLSRARNRRAR